MPKVVFVYVVVVALESVDDALVAADEFAADRYKTQGFGS